MSKNNFRFDKQALERFLIEEGFNYLPKIEFCDKFAFINGFYRPSENKIKIFFKAPNR